MIGFIKRWLRKRAEKAAKKEAEAIRFEKARRHASINRDVDEYLASRRSETQPTKSIPDSAIRGYSKSQSSSSSRDTLPNNYVYSGNDTYCGTSWDGSSYDSSSCDSGSSSCGCD